MASFIFFFLEKPNIFPGNCNSTSQKIMRRVIKPPIFQIQKTRCVYTVCGLKRDRDSFRVFFAFQREFFVSAPKVLHAFFWRVFCLFWRKKSHGQSHVCGFFRLDRVSFAKCFYVKRYIYFSSVFVPPVCEKGCFFFCNHRHCFLKYLEPKLWTSSPLCQPEPLPSRSLPQTQPPQEANSRRLPACCCRAPRDT